MKFLLSLVLCVAVVAQLTTAADRVYSLPEEALFLLTNMLPADKFNEQCLANDCPELKGLCPILYDDGSIAQVITAAIGCMTTSVCGVVVDPNAVPTSTFDSTKWPVYHETETCTVNKGGELSDASHANMVRFSEARRIIKLHVTTQDITAVGDITCGDNQATIHYDHLMTFNYSIAFSQNPFTLAVVDPEWKFNSLKYDITTANGTMTKDISQFNPSEIKIQESAIQTRYAVFLTKYYQTAIEVAKQNCSQ